MVSSPEVNPDQSDDIELTRFLYADFFVSYFSRSVDLSLEDRRDFESIFSAALQCSSLLFTEPPVGWSEIVCLAILNTYLSMNPSFPNLSFTEIEDTKDAAIKGVVKLFSETRHFTLWTN